MSLLAMDEFRCVAFLISLIGEEFQVTELFMASRYSPMTSTCPRSALDTIGRF